MLNQIKKWLNKKNNNKELSTYEKIDNLFESLAEDILQLKMGSDLVPFADSIVALVGSVREEVKEECGFILPAVRINDNSYMQENEINLFIRGICRARIYVIPTEDGIRDELYDTS